MNSGERRQRGKMAESPIKSLSANPFAACHAPGMWQGPPAAILAAPGNSVFVRGRRRGSRPVVLQVRFQLRLFPMIN
jgi:hypothetical protein